MSTDNRTYDLIIKTKLNKEQRETGYSLMDIKQKGIEKETFKINSSGNIFFSLDNIRFCRTTEAKDKLIIIEKDIYNRYYLNCKHYKKDFNLSLSKYGAFMVYRSEFFKKDKNNNNKYYKLDKGDIIKLGKIYMKIIDIKLEKEETTNFQNMHNSYMTSKQSLLKSDLLKIDDSSNNKISILPSINSSKVFPKIYLKARKNNNKKILCRICYESYSNKKNPLINPCKCKGTMKYIHYKCLINWLKNKIEKPKDKKIINNEYISFDKFLFNCELCKTIYPYCIKYNNNIYNILPYLSQFNEYVTFESLDKIGKKTINIISLDNKELINIGRSSSSHICFRELSLSRTHCFIHKIKEELFIEDNNSRYGTLILIQNNKIEINDYFPLRLQVDSVYFKIKKNIVKSKSYFCCNVDTIKNINIEEKKEYQNQIKKYKNYNDIEFKDLDIDSDNDYSDKENENSDENLKDNKKAIDNKIDNIINIFKRDFNNDLKNEQSTQIEINENQNNKKYKIKSLFLDVKKNKKERKYPRLKNLDEYRNKEESLFSFYSSRNLLNLNHTKKSISTFVGKNIFIKNQMI